MLDAGGLEQGVGESRVAEQAAAEMVAEQFLTFRLADEVYGIGVLKVQEIIGMMPVTRVPRMPCYLRGVVNLRGRIIPVIDLSQRFGLACAQDTEVACIIVVQVAGSSGTATVGLIVDEVREVVDIADDQIEPVPDLGVAIDSSLIHGIGKLEQLVVLLLDIDQVLTQTEFEAVGLADAPAADGVEGEKDV
jgi:purine-binding chemotaxis protein CheW